MTRRGDFLPLLATIAFNAFNGVALLLTVRDTQSFAEWPLPALALLCLAPALLTSGLAGALAHRFDSARVLQAACAGQILVMALATIGLITGEPVAVIAALCALGAQTAIFAPAAWTLAAETTPVRQGVRGHALIASTIFLAILVAFATADVTSESVALCLLLSTSAFAWLLSRALRTEETQPNSPFTSLNPWRATALSFQAARGSFTVLLALLGIAWFWFYAAVMLTHVAARNLSASPVLHIGLLAAFCTGVALGAVLCVALSARKVEIGLVPFGSIGMSVFALDAAWLAPMAMTAAQAPIRFMLDVLLAGMASGLFVAPLYALVQQRTRPSVRSRVFAANHFVSALLVSAPLALSVAPFELTLRQILLTTALLNAGVALYIYSVAPEFLLRLLAWILVHLIYRLRTQGLAHLPERGPALLICNHVSYMDALVIAAACPRPVRYIMESAIFRIPVLNVIFRGMKAIPVAPAKEAPEVYERAFRTVAEELKRGHLVCIFPEGRLTSDGEVAEFRAGMMRILKETPVPVIPMALSGLWDSMFSRRYSPLWRRRPRRFWPRIRLRISAPIAPSDASLDRLRKAVLALRGDLR